MFSPSHLHKSHISSCIPTDKWENWGIEMSKESSPRWHNEYVRKPVVFSPL